MNTPNDPKGAAGALKTPLGLIPSYAMEQTAWVHKLGYDKYGPFNWRKTGVCASTYVNAILRHLNAWRDGETVDPESGISHLAHVACSCNILLDAGFCGTLQDDRNITPPNTALSKMDKPTGAFVYPIADKVEHTPQNTNNQLHETNKQDKGCDRNDTKYHNRGHDEVDYYESEGGFGYVSTFKIPIEFSDKVEPTPNQYTKYRLLEVGELIKEGDEYYCPFLDCWFFTSLGGSNQKAMTSNVYRRKVRANEPDLCTCGRIKINHFMLGLICEDCEIHWQDPY